MNSDLVIASVGFVVVLLVGVGTFFLLVDRFYEPSPVLRASRQKKGNDDERSR